MGRLLAPFADSTVATRGHRADAYLRVRIGPITDTPTHDAEGNTRGVALNRGVDAALGPVRGDNPAGASKSERLAKL
jgi:hypothetical protein